MFLGDHLCLLQRKSCRKARVEAGRPVRLSQSLRRVEVMTRTRPVAMKLGSAEGKKSPLSVKGWGCGVWSVSSLVPWAPGLPSWLVVMSLYPHILPHSLVVGKGNSDSAFSVFSNLIATVKSHWRFNVPFPECGWFWASPQMPVSLLGFPCYINCRFQSLVHFYVGKAIFFLRIT